MNISSRNYQARSSMPKGNNPQARPSMQKGNYSQARSSPPSNWESNSRLVHNSQGKGKVNTDFKKEKERFLNMPIDKKRNHYLCADKYITLKDIITWSSMGEGIRKNPSIDLQGGIYEPNQKINNKIGIFHGSITALEVDAIVNAANNSLLGGGGVDAAIHKAAGSNLLAECITLNGCETGEAKITGGYNLPAKYIIHTVGPIGENPYLLESCYINSFHLAVEHKLRTIAFPCISTGVYGYPNLEAAHVVLQTTRTFLEANLDDLDLIIFCLFLPVDRDAYMKLLPHYFPIM